MKRKSATGSQKMTHPCIAQKHEIYEGFCVTCHKTLSESVLQKLADAEDRIAELEARLKAALTLTTQNTIDYVKK